jgi:hypothetical protein
VAPDGAHHHVTRDLAAVQAHDGRESYSGAHVLAYPCFACIYMCLRACGAPIGKICSVAVRVVMHVVGPLKGCTHLGFNRAPQVMLLRLARERRRLRELGATRPGLANRPGADANAHTLPSVRLQRTRRLSVASGLACYGGSWALPGDTLQDTCRRSGSFLQQAMPAKADPRTPLAQ